jgi:hypothetical protein
VKGTIPAVAGPAAPDGPAAPNARRGAAVLPLLAALAVAAWFRSPMLVNPDALNSDAAVVGLQARHMLHGEWSPLLWGTGYQAPVEAVVAAGLFAVAGATPLALAAVPLLAHLLLVVLAWDVLRRRAPPWTAALLLLPLVFVTPPVHTVLANVARSWAMTAVLASVWLLDGAAASRRPLARFAAGALLAPVAIYFDLFAIVFAGALGLLALLSALDGGPAPRVLARRLAACAAGAAAGAAGLWIVRAATGAAPGEASLTTAGLALKLGLLRSGLAWLAGLTTYVPAGELYPTPWRPPLAYAWIPPVGAAALVGLLALAAAAAARRGALPWPARRLALFALATMASTIAAFLLSSKPSDLWSARYLAPIAYAAPFALLGARPLAGRALPALVAAAMLPVAVSGWLGHGAAVRGLLPARDGPQPPAAVAALREALRGRAIHHAVAPYWLSYRLSFLFEEDPVVVPLDASEDRYPPQREAALAARDLAFVFHPSEPRGRVEQVEPLLRASGAPYERLEVAGFTVLVAHRGAGR